MNNEFEYNRQKTNIKELNGMDTMNEQVKEIEIVLDEFFKTTTQDKVISLLEGSQRESEILDRIVGESKTFPLAAIEKILPLVKKLSSAAVKDPSNKKILNLLNHACDDVATYSRSLLEDGTQVQSDGTNEISYEAAATLDSNSLLKEWDKCFNNTLEQIKSDMANKDNIKLGAHCQNLWNLSNLASIFF